MFLKIEFYQCLVLSCNMGDYGTEIAGKLWPGEGDHGDGNDSLASIFIHSPQIYRSRFS